jgi:hypothetical protein
MQTLITVRNISSFVIIVGLILAVTGFGVWAASMTPYRVKAHVEDTRGAIPIGGLFLVNPLVY